MDLRGLVASGGAGAIGFVLLVIAARVAMWVAGKLVKLVLFVVLMSLGMVGVLAAVLIHRAAQHPGGMDAVMAGDVVRVARLALGL